MTDKIPLKPKQDDIQTFSVRAEKKLIEQLDKLSSETGHSRNKLIIQALTHFVEHVEIVKK
ncbi:hypothetical protein PWEIH_07646 [Listeria weihenstephanensis FSL R9-0317]|uniref:Ribbon-helix-helix protein CopG domain-containing protein n=1 Tax=Listeria weihenstephanensis TaxID=1006155 RepID=A0A1S7FVS6_9LIST|nr:ribbon-helix-helix protein, CopG family [Listeria weihenstephanensis]AQY51536.1 hypothetical protein UE46_11150 [Listeria weihenstephanensis]EUJ39278.1 hypothetical protein PWEIH_07646 [Listeria weihenstephanensis FSL R9-0317]